MEKATFAGGCFWCTEAIFKRLRGVASVVVGYTGGETQNPTYEKVCTGSTGHAEAVQITFDPKIISFATLLDVFWGTHDPTTLNRQGNDSGTQYRSAIFYHNDEQKRIAEVSKERVEREGRYKDPIVTQIVPFTTFYKAEAYHQNYFERNADAPYCQYVISPKIKKLMEGFRQAISSNPSQ